MKWRAATLTLLFAMLAATAALPSCSSAPTSELDGTSWLVEAYGRPGEMIPVMEGTNVSVDFEGNGVVSGSTGCNEFKGTYKVEDDALTIQYEIGSGPRCDLSAIVEQEQMFLATLILAKRYSLDGDTLTIDCGERTLVLIRRLPAG